MLEQIKAELDKVNALSTPLPSFITELAKTIPNNKIPLKMKLSIVMSELVLFISQFRKNIAHPNTSKIPINAISFCITGSGAGKDSSVNIVRKNFAKGYEVINQLREQRAIDKAIAKAVKEKKAKASEESVYMQYYSKPYPLFAAPSTPEGYISYLNELDNDGIGAGMIFDGEFGASLANNTLIISNLQLLSELYDEGKKEVKIIKSKENQSSEIKNLPVSALFVSSPEHILFDESIKKKFKTEFNTKLARRSFFNYNKALNPNKQYKDVKEMLDDELNTQTLASSLIKKYQDKFEALALSLVDSVGKDIAVSSEVFKLMTLFKKYNEALADTISREYPLSKLVITHSYWRAFKLAGALAILKGKDELDSLSYKQAITFTVMLNDDMLEFEDELNKEPYEMFVSYAHSLVSGDKPIEIKLHTLKKLGYIQGNSNTSTRLKELCTLASSYDETGFYLAKDNVIEFKKIVKTEQVGVSFKKVSGSKDDRAKQCADSFTYVSCAFSQLGDLLKDDYAYSPFEFKNGIRNKSNIISGFNWICLDIDKSDYTDKEMHEILSGFNHHIVRTSDKTNAFKFRVLLELEAMVELDEIAYKKFISSVSDYLGLQADILPKSQIFFSYKDREILSITNAKKLEVKEHILQANLASEQKSVVISELNQTQKKTLLSDPLGTFVYAYRAKEGEGSFSLIKAAKHARDLGMDKEGIINLMHDINDFWDSPMPLERLENTIISQIRKWEC